MSLEIQLRSGSAALTHNDYKLGWICALPKEQTAAMAMLDQIHPELPKLPNDSNSYTLGSIGEHNIVIACLPKGKIGTLSAAAVASQMARTFPSIKVGLMVGIGGGIPPKVRLGDVVISAPVAEYPGVVQWDMGKAETEMGGGFKRTGAMNNPPAPLLTALTKLETMRSIHGSRIGQYVEEMGAKYPALASNYTWSDALKDPLSNPQPSYGSKVEWQAILWKSWAAILLVFGYLFNIELSILFSAAEKNNAALEVVQVFDQTPRKPGDPHIHYGLVASGNQVIKDAATRDRLNESLGGHVLCVEMEAAGLMDNFPCLVIRGICDYADAQKNKDWQEYAAAVAAACAKELLNYIQPGDVDAEHPLKDLVNDLTDTTQTMNKNVQCIQSNLNRKEELEILNWLTEIDYGPQHSDFLRKWQPGTGQWFLESTKYRNWWGLSQQTLFCPGIPGAGKTTLVAAVIQDLTTRFANDPSVGIAYVYCTFRQEQQQRAEDMMSSLLKQLSQNHSGQPLPVSVQHLYNRHKEKKTRPSFDELSETLTSVVENSKTFIIIDALDECQVIDESRSLFLSEILSLVDKTATNFLATSRPIPEIERMFDGRASQRVSASADDIRSYLDCHMNRLPAFVHDRPELKEEIKASIIDVVDGMFLLARLHLDSLIGIKAPKALRLALKKLPSGSDAYDHAYHEAMDRVRSQNRNSRETAEQALAWITYARRQLSVSELQHALAVESGDREFDVENIVEVPDILSVCAGLVTADKDSNVIRLVHYTTQEYLERTGHLWFPDAEERMAKTCATYLSFQSFSSGPSQTWKEMWERVTTYKLYQYAAGYWGHHARRAAVSSPELLDFLMCNAKVEASIQTIWRHLRTMPLAREEDMGRLISFSGDFRSEAEATGMTGVHLAAYFGVGEVLKDLLQQRREVDVRDKADRTPLIWASIKGHDAVITQLLDHGADIEAKDNIGRTALTYASNNRCEEVLKRLIESGADTAVRDSHGDTPLLLAAMYGFQAIFATLLDESSGYSKAMLSEALLPAAENGHSGVLKELLDRHGNLLRMSDYGEGTLLVAPQYDHEAAVELTPDGGFETRPASTHDRNPLVAAARNGHGECVTVLLEKYASLEMKDSRFRMPLLEATRNGHTETVQQLLLAGADIDSQNEEGNTPLSHASWNGAHLMVKLLLGHGADLEVTDRYRQTALFVAVFGGCAKTVEQLLRAGANKESRDAEGYTPLLWAAKNGKEKIAKILLDNGASFEAEDSEGRTPLFWAAMNGRYKVATILVAQGAGVDKRNKYSETPLLWAAGNGHEGVVELLLESGADVDAQDAHGDTPLLWAIWDDHQKIVKLLLNKGADWKMKNCYGEDAMIRALTNNRPQIQRILVKARYGSKLAK